MIRLAAVLAALVVAAAQAGCTMNGLAFRADDRIRIVQPRDRAEVKLPLTVTWTAPGLRVTEDGPFFAVFVDRPPIRPGQSLRAVADDQCNDRPGCPDLAYLRSQFVFVTDEPTVTLDAVPPADDAGASDRHEVTIVLIDERARRIGEAAYYVEFSVQDGRSVPRRATA